MTPRLIPAPISIAFSEVSEDTEAYEREYHKLSSSDDNSIAQWVKLTKARGDAPETDPILLNLLIELHNKIDSLERFIKNEKPKTVLLSNEARIDSIGFEYFNLKEDMLSVGSQYYGRVDMPVHPKRDVGVFFIAQSPTLAKIIKIHERDEKEWGAYLTARERVLIREAKESKQ